MRAAQHFVHLLDLQVEVCLSGQHGIMSGVCTSPSFPCPLQPRMRACRLLFSYEVLTPAALNFFVSYADGAVESLWSIDQYFEFVLVLMLSTGLSFQACVGTIELIKLHNFSQR